MPSNQVMPDSETGDGKPGLHAPPRQCGGKWTWIGLAAFLVAIAVIAPTTIILTRGSNNDNFAQQAEDIAILSGAGVQVVITIRTTGTYSEALMVGEGYCTELKSEGTFTKCRATVVRADSRRRLQQSDAYNIIVIGDTPAVTPGNANGNTKAEVKGNVADVLKYFSRRGIVVAVAVQCAVNTFIVNAACTPCTSCSAASHNFAEVRQPNPVQVYPGQQCAIIDLQVG
ncbi:hypothetical protein FOA52_010888 [Chlamydomonas sp. UWO 241]|nr:hypothetical protein FOA52_010888 [Chlamydomonas sp. UWO 241]